jgi:hypothetical protein
MNDNTLTKQLSRGISGALKSAITAHGPITVNNYGSAAKRMFGQVKSVLKRFNIELDQRLNMNAREIVNEVSVIGWAVGSNLEVKVLVSGKIRLLPIRQVYLREGGENTIVIDTTQTEEDGE